MSGSVTSTHTESKSRNAAPLSLGGAVHLGGWVEVSRWLGLSWFPRLREKRDGIRNALIAATYEGWRGVTRKKNHRPEA